jgi:dihydroorotate dehydrogenase electron transfer subunit
VEKGARLIDAAIIEKQTWGEYVLLRLLAPEISSRADPGQFVMVRINQQLIPLLRRPFSLLSVDRDEGTLGIFFQKVGVGTILLSRYFPGEALSLIGPLGRGFSFEEVTRGDRVLLVGGGRGIAPLFFLARRLKERGVQVTVFYGGKTEKDLPLKKIFEEEKLMDKLVLTTEDGSLGKKGLVTDILEKEWAPQEIAKVFVCGPEAMMKRIAQLTQARGVPSEFSLEAFMGCGFGVCWGCVRRIRRPEGFQWVKICEEGPVFPGEVIDWQDEEEFSGRAR